MKPPERHRVDHVVVEHSKRVLELGPAANFRNPLANQINILLKFLVSIDTELGKNLGVLFPSDSVLLPTTWRWYESH